MNRRYTITKNPKSTTKKQATRSKTTAEASASANPTADALKSNSLNISTNRNEKKHKRIIGKKKSPPGQDGQEELEEQKNLAPLVE